MSPRTGRPKTDNPKSERLTVRFDDDTLKKLDAVAQHFSETRVDAIRRSINQLYSEIKK